MLVVFTVRPYQSKDLTSVVAIYQAAFAEPPWNEMWSDDEVISDLRFAMQQPKTVVLVAEVDEQVVGMTWGYQLPQKKFGFLPTKNFSYLDEMAVSRIVRQQGIGTALGNAYIESVKSQGLPGVVLRTDRRNTSSMALFGKLGFSSDFCGKKIFDPEFPDRVYLWRKNVTA